MPCGLSHLEYRLSHATYGAVTLGIRGDPYCVCVSPILHIVDDVLDSVLAGSDDEAEEDAVISQVSSSFAHLLDPLLGGNF